MALDENNVTGLLLAGWLLYRQGKTIEALEYLTKAMLIKEGEADILYMKALCHLRLAQYNKSYDLLHKLLTDYPRNAMYWCSLGILFAEKKQVVYFIKAIIMKNSINKPMNV